MNGVAKDARGDNDRNRHTRSSGDRPRVQRSDERYRPRGRRTVADPLRASWRPEELEQKQAKRAGEPAKTGLRRITSTYGWRIYLVPVLLVATALIVVNTAREPSRQADGSATQFSTTGTSDDSSPVVSERPAAPPKLDIPTAELPAGGAFTESGNGTWHVVPLPKDGESGKRAGTGSQLYTYTIEVEDGLDPASYTGDDAFATAVEGTLSDPRSWTGAGDISLQRVDSGKPDFRVRLTSNNTAIRPDICGFGIQYPTSCYIRGLQHSVVINLARWVRGAKAFGADMTGYRQYAINHEVGHALGLGHVGCKENGAAAPVMMQQTFGVSNDYVAQLNSVDQYNKNAVPADGKVCKPNSWPVPDLGDKMPS